MGAVCKIRAKDVLPNINRMQAPKSLSDSDGMVPSAVCVTWFAACTFHSIAVGGAGSAEHILCPR